MAIISLFFHIMGPVMGLLDIGTLVCIHFHMYVWLEKILNSQMSLIYKINQENNYL